MKHEIIVSARKAVLQSIQTMQGHVRALNERKKELDGYLCNQQLITADKVKVLETERDQVTKSFEHLNIWCEEILTLFERHEVYEALCNETTKPIGKQCNKFALLDMQFSELEGVMEDYSDPETVPEILWVVQHSSYTHKDNGEAGVYDFIFNLAMLDHYLDNGDVPTHLAKQLKAIQADGYHYILFNQGC